MKKAELQLLTSQRDLIQIEADAIHSELTSNGINGEAPAGVSDSLIDAEGFPRGDIDIYNVKSKRARLRVLNTDYKAVMKQIEELLPQVFEEQMASAPSQSSMASVSASASVSVSSSTLSPIAKLDEILEGSPAHDAGVLDGDLLLSFGGVSSASSANPLADIPALVKQAVDSRGAIELLVRRRTGDVSISITPKPWGGRGLLGCHLTPLR